MKEKQNKRQKREVQKRKTKEDFLAELEQFCLLDDTFMTKCFADSPECVELVLRIILDRPDLKVVDMQHQYEIKNLQGHSIEMDIFVTDEQGRKYNIEVQRKNSGAGPKRARYHSSLIDANALKKRKKYEKLPESYVIFITENDVRSGNNPIYCFKRIDERTGEVLDDDTYIIYVNGKYRADTPLGKLMHDFSCTKADDMHYKILADRVRCFKETEGGREDMCEIMEKIYKDGARYGSETGRRIGRREGRREGRDMERQSLAKRLLTDGRYTLEEVSNLCKIPLREVEKMRVNIAN